MFYGVDHDRNLKGQDHRGHFGNGSGKWLSYQILCSDHAKAGFTTPPNRKERGRAQLQGFFRWSGSWGNGLVYVLGPRIWVQPRTMGMIYQSIVVVLLSCAFSSRQHRDELIKFHPSASCQLRSNAPHQNTPGAAASDVAYALLTSTNDSTSTRRPFNRGHQGHSDVTHQWLLAR